MINLGLDFFMEIFPKEYVLEAAKTEFEVKSFGVSSDSRDYLIKVKSIENFIRVNPSEKFSRYYEVVNLKLDEDYDFSKGSCSCWKFKRYGCCVHMVMALGLAIEHLKQEGIFYDKRAFSNLVEVYGDEDFLSEKTKRINLKTKLVKLDDLLGMEMQLGEGRLYKMKNVSHFLSARALGTIIKYGKGFTYDARTQRFSEEEEALLDCLYALEGVHSEHYSYNSSNRKVFLISESEATLIFKFLRPLSFDFEDKAHNIDEKDLRIIDGNPNFSLELKSAEGGCIFEKTDKSLVPLLDDFSYVYCGGKIFSPSEDYRKMMAPLAYEFMKSSKDELFIKDENIPLFMNNVLIKINRKQEIKIDEGLKRKYEINPLKAVLKLDMKRGQLVGNLIFRYGEHEINPLNKKAEKTTQNVVRDFLLEEQILRGLEETPFKVRSGEFFIKNEEDIYEFLMNSESVLNAKHIEVYYSEDLKDGIKNTNEPVKSYFGYNSDIDMLEFSLDIPNASEEELSEIILSLKKRKKYFRLKSGDFISLERGVFNDLQELELTGDLDFSSVSNGKIRFSKYRALYLEKFMKERENLTIKENVKLNELIFDIRNGTEKEYSVPSELKEVLRDYQIRGYRFLRTLHNYGFGGILADEMGLGKTLQMIAFLKSMRDEGYGQSLLVVPTSLVSNWVSEFKRFAPSLDVVVIKGTSAERKLLISESEKADVVLTSYPLMRNDFLLYERNLYESVVLDEGQYIKSYSSLNAKSVKTLRAKSRFVLTGTPMENALSELHSVFDFLMPGYLLSRNKFASVYEKPIISGDETSLRALREHIEVFMVRRLKHDVLKELPEKIEQEIKIDLTLPQKKIYAAHLLSVKSDIKQKLEEKGLQKSRFEILSLLTRLRQICQDPSIFIEDYDGGSGKLDALMDLLFDLIESKRRALVFSSFTSVLGKIEERLKAFGISYQYLDGKTEQDIRGERVEAFNRGEGEVFLISLRAGGTGLNLFSADTVIHFDPWWNPAVEDQATDRAHRIGQKKTVQVIRLVAEGTIEEKIYELQAKKRSLIDKVIEEGEMTISQLSEEEILKLLEE